ncbi:mucin-5AC-like isoform X49 [Amblyraja radiata]|uniref:mucin-5AC-like isoform X49 n=1 Tax=Amblyraja radiata TaxID=386614 RepID=UPI0014024A05|nr:mucin-5AC-like isoform X49 [Amblyraja radiata]
MGAPGICTVSLFLLVLGRMVSCEPSDTFCLENEVGIHADPEDASSFYQCLGNATIYSTCQRNLIFDIVSMWCVKPPTAAPPQTTAETQAAPVTTARAPMATSKPLIDISQLPVASTKTPGATSQAPVATPANLTESLLFCRGKTDGFYEDLEDVTFYYFCWQGETNHIACAPGLVFSIQVTACIHLMPVTQPTSTTPRRTPTPTRLPPTAIPTTQVLLTTEEMAMTTAPKTTATRLEMPTTAKTTATSQEVTTAVKIPTTTGKTMTTEQETFKTIKTTTTTQEIPTTRGIPVTTQEIPTTREGLATTQEMLTTKIATREIPTTRKTTPVQAIPTTRETTILPEIPTTREATTQEIVTTRKTTAVPEIPTTMETTAVPEIATTRKTTAVPEIPTERETTTVQAIPTTRETTQELATTRQSTTQDKPTPRETTTTQGMVTAKETPAMTHEMVTIRKATTPELPTPKQTPGTTREIPTMKKATTTILGRPTTTQEIPAAKSTKADLPKTVQVSTTAGPIDWDPNFCSDKESGLYPDPLDRSSFFQCFLGQTFHLLCPVILVFNPKTGTCDWPEDAVEDTDIFNATFCRDRVDGNYADPLNPNMFYQCVTGTAFHMACQGNLVFDPLVNACLFAYSTPTPAVPWIPTSTQGVTTTIRKPNICCGIDDGIYADSKDTSAFYQCVEEVTFYMSCHPKMVFNPYLNVCDYP